MLFRSYGFNKSHSTAYAMVSYQTAYLKANFPTEFMAAVMTCEMSNTDKIFEYLEEARRLSIEVLPPDLNRSERKFSVEGDKIRYGLEAVKGVGGKLVDAVLESRDREGPFQSIFELCERVDSAAINKGVLESMIACGAVDCFGKRRSQLMAAVENALQRGSEARRDRKMGQVTFFDLFEGAASGSGGEAKKSLEGEYPDVPEWSEAERLSREKKALGFYLTGHPLLRWQAFVRRYATHTLAEMAKASDGAMVTIGVQVSKITKKVSKRTSEPFWIALVEDLTGSLEVFITQEHYDAFRDFLKEDELVLLRGIVRSRDTNPSMRLESMLPFGDAPAKLTEDLSFLIPLDDAGRAEDLLFRLKGLFQDHRGSCPVYLLFRGSGSDQVAVLVGQENYVAPDLELLEAADNLCGSGKVLVNRMGHRGKG